MVCWSSNIMVSSYGFFAVDRRTCILTSAKKEKAKYTTHGLFLLYLHLLGGRDARGCC